MKVSKVLFAAGLLIYGFTDPGWAQRSSCEECHGRAKVDFRRSIHKERGMACVDCHGGDPLDMTRSSMSKDKGFLGKINKKDVPYLCAKCHSDVELMLQYGEYIDEFAVYRHSQHGKILYKKGDTKVAVCTDCHSAHDIKKAEDPESWVYPFNVPTTCARCHSDKNLMQDYGIPTDQYEKYKESIHGKLRLEKKDLRAPGCPDCHGVHGATPPGVDEVHSVCGKCHFPQRNYFQESPHFEAMKDKKINECASCHGSHGIEAPTYELFTSGKKEEGSGCGGCHSPDSREYLLGVRIKNDLLEAEKSFEKASLFIETARLKGFEVDEERIKLKEAKAKITEVLPITHSVSIPLVEQYITTAKAGAEDVKELVNAKIVEWKDRRVMFVINIFIFLFVVILLIIKRKRIMPKSNPPTPPMAGKL
ncbi:MAG: cytochrome c3 family protein [Deltaproteobacteria bacterium]|nr:MAG: cytochrome c3 family protein [Deltaproteobacteria bacterium]